MRFDVEYEHRVYFGRDRLAPEGATLARGVGGEEARGPTSVAFVIDEGLADARSSLESEVREYARAHASSMALRGPLVCVPGGELCKNDPRVLDSPYGAQRARERLVSRARIG